MANEQKIREKREEAQHLIAIKESPSYPVLKAIVEEKIQAEFRKFVAEPAVSQQGLDYARGEMFGMQWVLNVIERGEKEFQKAVRMAQTAEALAGAEGA